MDSVVAAFGILFMLLGALGVAKPHRVIESIAGWSSGVTLAVAVGSRAVLGTVLLLAAPTSRAPLLLQVLGVIALVAAAVFLALGPSRLRRLVDWWLAQARGLNRFSFGFAILLGALLVWAVV